MPELERPRERLRCHGASKLKLDELIAIVLRTGTRERSALGLGALIVSRLGERGLADATVEDLTAIKGIGVAKAVEVVAAIELGRRIFGQKGELAPVIHNPANVVELIRSRKWDKTREHFWVVALNAKNRVLSCDCDPVSTGILDSSLVHPREVFKQAVKLSAAAVIVAHNHPSGDPAPSAEDERVTKRLADSGSLLGIEVLDHLILGDGAWVSLKQKDMF